MSEFVDTLAKIADAGGTIVVLGGEIRVEVRPGLLDDLDKEVLTRHKPDILSMLTPADADKITPHTGKTAIVSTPAAETVSQTSTETNGSRRHLPWPIEGADEVLRLTPADLPTTPWIVGSLSCFDNGRVLTELRIDLQVIGYGGVNHRSGRLRRDVGQILQAARRVRA